MERARGEPRPGWERRSPSRGWSTACPAAAQGGVAAAVLGRVGALRLLDGRDPRPWRPTSRSALDVPGGRRPRRHHRAVPRLRAARVAWEAVAASWRRSDPHVYGRFDLRYDGGGPAKLLEYNADTPTTLLEASILQWYWLQGRPPRRRPVELAAREARRALGRRSRARLPGDDVHFTWSRGDATGEDHVTVGYLQETAAEAGLDTVGLSIEDIGWDAALDRFVDLEEAPDGGGVQALPLGVGAHRRLRQARRSAACPRRCGSSRCGRRCCRTRRCSRCCGRCTPATPTCCPPTWTSPGLLTEYVRKPRLGREGANISIVAPGTEIADRRRLRRGGLRLPALRPAARVRRLPPRAGRVDRRRRRRRAGHPRDRRAGDRRRRGLRSPPHPRPSSSLEASRDARGHRPRVLPVIGTRHRRDPALRRARRAADAARLLGRRHHHARQAQPAWSARACPTPCWSRRRAWSSMAFIVVRVDLHARPARCSTGLLATLIFGLVGHRGPGAAACGCWSGSRASRSARCWPRRGAAPRRGWWRGAHRPGPGGGGGDPVAGGRLAVRRVAQSADQ